MKRAELEKNWKYYMKFHSNDEFMCEISEVCLPPCSLADRRKTTWLGPKQPLRAQYDLSFPQRLQRRRSLDDPDSVPGDSLASSQRSPLKLHRIGTI